MKIGAMNHPAKDILEEIDWIGRNGFDYIDLTYEPPSSGQFNIASIKGELERQNLMVVGHTNPTLPAVYPISTVREACLDELKKSIDFLTMFGAKKITIHPFFYGGHQETKKVFERNIEVLQKITAYCEELGVQPMIENYIAPFGSPEGISEVLDQVPGLKVHLDIAHCNLQDDPELLIKNFFKKFKKNIIHLHIHDNKGENDDHLPIGCGTINWPNVIKIIKNSGYDGTITLEVFTRDPEYLYISKRKLKKLWNEIQ